MESIEFSITKMRALCRKQTKLLYFNGLARAKGSVFSTLCVIVAGAYSGQSCCERDRLLQGQYLEDGQELVSSFNIFKLKFFNFKNSSNRYLGIWYNSLYLNDIQDRAVWIANRNNPVPGPSGSLTVDSLGRLKILTGASTLLELSSTETTGNTTLNAVGFRESPAPGNGS
ncbi:unnamed protein product [Microthlaspi erraticum]|uniref:Bulb-type lectin domain-containing protein n=1 Tax=Microthlaspi erraticum TaxID=1685480 RepID=A0A6D2JSC4_9BRAS|nr:unnamed protein product [Microthlaspi erraticum]